MCWRSYTIVSSNRLTFSIVTEEAVELQYIHIFTLQSLRPLNQPFIVYIAMAITMTKQRWATYAMSCKQCIDKVSMHRGGDYTLDFCMVKLQS